MRTIYLILIPLVFFQTATYGQRRVEVKGCYEDLKEKNGDIIGSGVITLKRSKGRIVGTFEELSNELGLAFDPVPLQKVTFDRKKNTIRFNLRFHNHHGVAHGLIGYISRRGIQMNWRVTHAMYGGSRPFFKRLPRC